MPTSGNYFEESRSVAITQLEYIRTLSEGVGQGLVQKMEMQKGSHSPPTSRFPVAWLTLGVLVGVAYTIVDTAMDISLMREVPVSGFQWFHRLFDALIPPVAGSVVGMLFAYMRQRDARIAAEQRVSEALRERLKGVERQQAVWLLASSLLHDVRNPLHALGLVLDEATDRQDFSLDELHASLTRARAQVDRIDQKIASLRGLADSLPRQRRQLELDRLVQALTTDLTPVAERMGVELQVGSTCADMVNADERYVRTPLENLVMNALEAASRASQSPKVHVWVEQAGEEMRILVSDNGPGVPEEIQRVLFEPLHSAKELGLGLGLPLARALSRLEGGDVKLLQSGPPETVFCLTLPSSTARPPAAPL